MSKQPEIPESHRDLVRAPSTVVLSTLNSDGTIQSTAVWAMLDDDGLVRTSLQTDRHKYRNLRRHPTATIFSMDPTNPYRTLEIRGEIELAPDDEERTFTRRIITSYGMALDSMEEQIDADRAIMTLVPTRVIAQG
jgi:PPOX class probable F420-dependent enzyme